MPRVRRVIHRSRPKDGGEFSMSLHGREGLQHVGNWGGKRLGVSWVALWHLFGRNQYQRQELLIIKWRVSSALSMCFLPAKNKREERGFGYMIDTPNRTFPLSGSNSLALALQPSEKSTGRWAMARQIWKKQDCQGFSSQVFCMGIQPQSSSQPPKRISDPPKITIWPANHRLIPANQMGNPRKAFEGVEGCGECWEAGWALYRTKLIRKMTETTANL